MHDKLASDYMDQVGRG